MKKKLLYTITPQGEELDRFITKAVPSTSKWWSGLPNLMWGIKNLAEVMRAPENLVPGGIYPTTVKACPGISDLLRLCYIVKFPTDIIIDIEDIGEEEPVLRWKVPCTDLLSIFKHPREQYRSKNFQVFEGHTNIKFQLPVILNTKNKFSFTFIPPVYHMPSVPYIVQPGIMTTDKNMAIELNVNTMFPNHSATYHFKAGDPIAYILALDNHLPDFQKTELLYHKTRRLSFMNNYRKRLKDV